MVKILIPAYSWLRRTGVAVTIAALAGLSITSSAAASPQPAAGISANPSASAPQAAAAASATTFDVQMVALVNGARSAAGVGRVTQATGLTQLSRWWSTQLENGVTGYNLAHNPNAWDMVTRFGASNRTAWAENVGWSSSNATTAAQLFSAYMNSAPHRANIMSARYRYIGMGTVGGTHGLFNTTELTDVVQAGQAVVPPAPATYEFVRDISTSAVYRMAGGAPVYVSSFAPFAGSKVIRSVTHAQVLAMPRFPADGTFLRTLGNGAVYRMAGGAPVYVSSWAPFGGSKASVAIDPAAVANAGGAGYWIHLRAVPADGTFVRTPGTGAVYRMAGGAPLYVASWAVFGGAKPYVDVDPAAVAYSGRAGWWTHLKMYPVNNSYLQGAGAAAIYRVTNGVATHVISWSQVGGPKPFTVVHPYAISDAGSGGYYIHLRK